MVVKCSICDKNFNNISNLNRHKKEVHSVEENTIVQYNFNDNLYKCLEGCKVSFKFHLNLISHLENMHNTRINTRILKFKDYRDFEIWLNIEQKQKFVHYIKTCGSRISKDKKYLKIYYECFRSGEKRLLDENIRKRRLKRQGSMKINHSCTSRIILTRKIQTNRCEATYFETHYGHEIDIDHIRLSNEVKKTVASQLLEGKSSKEILAYVQEDQDLVQERDLLLKRKDINNIKQSFNLMETEETKVEEKPKLLSGSYYNKIKLSHEKALSSWYRVEYKPKFYFVYYAENQCPYIVRERNGEPCCELKCIECNVCVHIFECTCKDFMKKAIICEHIHFCLFNKSAIISGMYSKAKIDVRESERVDEMDQSHDTEIEQSSASEEIIIELENAESEQSETELFEIQPNTKENPTDEQFSDDSESIVSEQCERHKIRSACLQLLHNIETKPYSNVQEQFIYNNLNMLNSIKASDEPFKVSNSIESTRSGTVENIKIIFVDD